MQAALRSRLEQGETETRPEELHGASIVEIYRLIEKVPAVHPGKLRKAETDGLEHMSFLVENPGKTKEID